MSEGALYRTKIHCYFLDQSRVIRTLPTEKNYHIFYQVQRTTTTSSTRYSEELPHLLPGTEKNYYHASSTRYREQLPHLLLGTEKNYPMFNQVQRRTTTSSTKYREEPNIIFYQVQRRTTTSSTRYREELPHLLPGTESNYHIFYQVQRRTTTSSTRYREQLPHLLPGTEKKIWIL